MTCQVYKGTTESLFDAKEAMGYEHGWPKRGYKIEGDRKVPISEAEEHALQLEEEKRTIVGDESTHFLCGDFVPEPICRCGHIAGLLCDYPIGRGKTCDLPICPKCSVRIRDDVDLCTIHAIEHRAGKLRRVTFKGVEK